MIYSKQEWYTPAEVAIHNVASDCWISLNGKVFNMTPWLEQQFKLCKCTNYCSCPFKNWYCPENCVEFCNCFKWGFSYCDAKRLAMTILAYAGKDVSHWFDGEEWVKYIHPIVGTNVTYMRHGHGQRQPVVPSTRWRPYGTPWWLDENLVVGKRTAKTRMIRILNTLSGLYTPKPLTADTTQRSQQHAPGNYLANNKVTNICRWVNGFGFAVTIEVCSEETLDQIMLRYLPHNRQFHSYTWRYLGRGLCNNWNLEKNGIKDEREIFDDVSLPDNVHVPTIFLYYNDDLTGGAWPITCECNLNLKLNLKSVSFPAPRHKKK